MMGSIIPYIRSEGNIVASVSVNGSMIQALSISGSIATNIATDAQMTTQETQQGAGAPMFPFLSIIDDGNIADWVGKPLWELPDWQCVSPGVTPPDRAHWITAGIANTLSKYKLANVPYELEIINYIRIYFDFTGYEIITMPGISAGIYLDDVLFETLKTMKMKSVTPTLKMLEWTGLVIDADVFKNATKRELWIRALDGGSFGEGDPPKFEKD